MTKEISDYCPHCETAVSYNDNGEEECECEWREGGSGPTSPEDEAIRARAEGREWRHWDPAYQEIRLRSRSAGMPYCFVKKATLGQIARIERLRWKAYLIYRKRCNRVQEICKEIYANGNDAFIPVTEKAVQAEVARWVRDGEQLSNEQLTVFRYPSRIRCRPSPYFEGALSVMLDDDYWLYMPPKCGTTDMEIIAAASHLGEWEQEILPSRIQHASDPKRLELGRRYTHGEALRQASFSRTTSLDDLLSAAVLSASVLPEGKPYIEDRITVSVNGRQYPFCVGPYTCAQAIYKDWPRPTDPAPVVIPERFALDESLIGVASRAVQVRLGEPLQKDRYCWAYPTGVVHFNHATNVYDCVVAWIEQRPTDV